MGSVRTRHSTRSRGRSRSRSPFRKQSRKRSSKHRLHKIPEAVSEAIGQERYRLCRASTLLKCLRYAADYADDPKEIDTASVAEMANGLIDEAISGLDSARLVRAGQDGDK